MNKKLVWLFSLLLIVETTYGQIPNCKDASSQIELERCLQKKYEYVDKRLNQVYDKVLKSIENTEEKEYINFTEKEKNEWEETLIEAQRSWVSFKEKDCHLMLYEHWGGSGVDAFIRGCLIRKTMNRIQKLKERYHIE